MSRRLCPHKKKILISIVIGFLGILVPSLCVLQNVAMAAGSNDAVITSILRCVEGGQFKSNMKASDLKGNASSFMSGSQKVYVPLGFSGSGPDATLSMTCKELVGKALTNKGINVPGTSTNPDEKVKFLKSLGYKPTQESTASTKSCFWFKYSVYDLAESSTVPRGTSITQSICANVKDGKIADTDISIESTDNDYYLNQFVEFEYHSKKSTLEVVFPGWTSNVDIPVAVGDSWDNLIQNVKLNVLNKRADFTFVTGGGEYRLNYKLIGEDGSANVQSGNASDINAEFTLTIDDASKRLITGTLTGGSTNVYPTFSGDDQFNMYQDYLRNYYAADIKCGATQDQIAAYYTESKGYYKVYSCTADDKMEPCYAKATKNAGKKVGGIDSARHFGSDCGFSCVANWLSSYGAAGDTCPAAEEPEPTTPTNNNNNKPSSGSTDDRGFCDEAVDKDGGIGAMQWILCPTLDNTTYTAGWIDDITQKALEVDSSIYEPGSDLHTIWGDIRDIANVVMVLFFLAIVFSQLTGRGIDNYGIKKMLPRLIVMAIIVNLSYYICAIAIDASNIAGEGLRDLFGRLGGNGSGETNGFVDAIMGLFGVGAAGASTAAGAASVAATLGAGGWVVAVVIIIVLILVVIVALVILWAMLGARLIIIILCVVVSPLAFAAFILPNTQNLFKKWWELFKAAIIIFPICGAVAGMSAALKKITLEGVVGAAGQLIIIILPYLVFFLLPMLLKQAIAALGKIGGSLTALGTTVKSGAKNIGNAAIQGAKGTERFKNRQIEAARNRQSESSQRTINRLEELKRQQGGKLNDTDTRRLARAHEVQRKLGLEDQAARTVLTEKDYAGKSLDDLMSDWNTAFDSGDTARMDALTNVIVSRHGPGGVSQIASSLANREGDNGIFAANGEFRNGNMEKSFTALQANMMQNSALATAMQNKASDVFQMVSGGGYVNGTRQNVSAHAANNGIATQMKDWATQSNGTIQRAAANGGFSAKMARDLLNSTDPTIQSGIQSDKDKRATLEAIAGGYTGDWSNSADVNRAKMNYAHEQALTENAEFDRRTLERQQVASQTENLRRAAEGLENLNRNQGGDNNSGQGFDQGAGI